MKLSLSQPTRFPFHPFLLPILLWGVRGGVSECCLVRSSRLPDLQFQRPFYHKNPQASFWVIEIPSPEIVYAKSVEHIFNILSCPDWPKGYCMNYFFFNLFKGLSLRRAPFTIVLPVPLHREGLQSDCNLGYAFSKNPQCLRKLVFPFC